MAGIACRYCRDNVVGLWPRALCAEIETNAVRLAQPP
jgi:hypothetical protein